MATFPMQFSFSAGPSAPARRLDDEAPMGLLVLADLGASPSARAACPLAQRSPVALGLDNFDSVFRKMAVQVDLTGDAPVQTLSFTSVDDFHPDALFERLPALSALRQQRAELADPRRFQAAAARLTGLAPAPTSAAVDAQPPDDLTRLLGRKTAAPAAPPGVSPSPGATALDAWMRRVVAPHVVADVGSAQAQWIAAVDAAIASELRRVLHQPAWQHLEANWRSIERLVRELDPGESLRLYVLDCSAQELAEDLSRHAGDLSGSALHRILNGPPTRGADGLRWSLLITDLSVGDRLDELQRLAALGALAARAGAALLAGAQPSLLGCDSVARLAEPATWTPLAPEVAAYWNALRQSPVAPWVGLGLPRILARLPYGRLTDPVSVCAFEEMPQHMPQTYLWGSAAYALAMLAGQAFLEDGWDMALEAGAELQDLPGHSYQDGGESYLQPCAEILMSESSAEAMARAGVMPFLSYRNRNAVRLLRWQSLAQPPCALKGPWS